MASIIRIDIEGSRQLRNKLTGRFMYALDAEGQSILEDTAEYALGIARSHAPVDLGALKQNLHTEIRALSVAIVSSKEYSMTQEFGRKKEKTPPPWPALFGWAQRHGKGGNPYGLAISIGRKGFRGKYFMTTASIAAEKYAGQRLAKASANIDKWWYKEY